MRHPRILILTCAGLLPLAGCGGSNESALTTREAFIADGQAFVAERERLEALRDTTTLNLPTVGEVTYTGSSALVVDTATETTFMIGDATMTADFAAGTVAGAMSHFVGATGPSADDPGDDALNNLVSYDGTLDLRNGVIGQIRGNDILTDFGGTLTGGSDTFTFDGLMVGVFKGNPAMGGTPNIQGALVESDDGEIAITANGAAASGVVGFEVSK